MSKFHPGQKVKLVNVGNPFCGFSVGDTGTIEAVDQWCCEGQHFLVNVVRMDTANKHFPDENKLHAPDDDLVPLDKPPLGSWEKLGFHPNDFLKEAVT